eukprot:GHRR01008059.1.p1 GENE.GHRR01008059.1~~GHRR01008059.1.p1  ORF type:complete len:220 (+),score=76.94 GHRR01008059.1:571-1230(+)
MTPATTQQHQQPQPWWAGPLQGMGAAIRGMQHNMQQFANGLAQPTPREGQPQASITLAAAPTRVSVAPASAASSASSNGQQQANVLSDRSLLHHFAPSTNLVTKEELGRATWTFLHTLAAQFPARPTRQQQRDARQLVDSLTRVYPCADCAQHFQEIVRRDPPDVSNGEQFSRWMCRVHNTVNRHLGKPAFNCDLVAGRWAPLDCDEHNSCDLTVGRRH